MGKKSKKTRVSKTAALRVLEDQRVEFEVHLYTYEPRGGTAVSSAQLGVSEHAVIKTLIMEDEGGAPLVVLMHGDASVSTKELARVHGVKQIRPCALETAQKHSGYLVGGTSPFGLKQDLPIYAEAGIQDLERLYINGGRRGMLVSMLPAELARVLAPKWVRVSVG